MSRVIAQLLRDARAAQAWFLFDAFAVCAFWIALAMIPGLRRPFILDGGGEHLLWSFAVADSWLVLASLTASAAAGRARPWRWVPMLVATSCVAYPLALLLAASVSGHGGELAVLFMLPLAALDLAFTVAQHAPPDGVAGRVAKEADPAWNVAKTAGELALLWIGLLVLLPAYAGRLEVAVGWLATGPSAAAGTGAAFFAAGTALLVWSSVVMAWRGKGTPFPFDAPRVLVLDGPYRHVRNPQVVGGLIQGLGLTLLLWSPLLLAALGAGVVVWQVILRPWEEAELVARFGPRYVDYQRRVPCWLPRLRPYARTEVASPLRD